MTGKSDSRKVLIVEDSARTAHGLAEMINYYDVKSEIVSDGDKAMKLLEDNEYFLIITNSRMPKVSGLQLLKDVKKHYPHIPVAVISTYDSASTRSIVTKHRADFYLPKPIRISDVKELLEAADELRNRR